MPGYAYKKIKKSKFQNLELTKRNLNPIATYAFDKDMHIVHL
jgi:hypothetical protein